MRIKSFIWFGGEKMNARKVLLLLRNRAATDWTSLCKELNIGPNSFTLMGVLRHTLLKLKDAGLVLFEGNLEEIEYTNIKIAISIQWEKIQTVLEISLTDLAQHDKTTTMHVKPCFGPPMSPATPSDLFVVMPFADELKPIYQDHILEIAKSR